MAVLQEQVSKFKNPFGDLTKDDLAPAGQWVATLIDVRDEFGVTRPSFDNPSVMETLDQTTLLFGFRDPAGVPHRIASRSMRISGNEKSNLMVFLKQALGTTPKYGWDYCAMKGGKFLLTVAHEQRRNGQGVFPVIAAICPLPAGLPADYRGAPAGGGGNGGLTGGTLNAQRSTPNAQVETAPYSAAAAAPVADDEPLPF